MRTKTPQQCKACQHFWDGGAKDSKYERWCCKHGKPAPDAVGHCKLVGSFKLKE